MPQNLKLATLCYVKHEGRTLMLHRCTRPHDMHQGKWNGLGGKFEPGETPEQCVIREVREECGLEIRDPEMRGFLTFPSFKGDEDWYVFLFVARQFSGALQPCAEGVLEWIEDERLPSLNLWEGDPIFFRWLDDRRFFSGSFRYVAGRLVSHHVVFHDR